MADISVSLPDEGPSQLRSAHTDASPSTGSVSRPNAETTPSPTSIASQAGKLTEPPLPATEEGQLMSNPIPTNPPPRPYGTRSRKRTGAARPNYAEDRETDIDDEYTGPSKMHGSPSTINVTRAPLTENGKPPGTSTRRTPGTANGNTPAMMNGTTGSTPHKDYIPGMSTFSANPNVAIPSQPTSKKRKAPGSVPVPTPQQVGHSMPGGGPTVSRRASAGINTGAGAKETNLLSFDNCQGYLKNGKLKADDGTALGINGTSDLKEPDGSHLPF